MKEYNELDRQNMNKNSPSPNDEWLCPNVSFAALDGVGVVGVGLNRVVGVE
jgi:hypothetical protein